MAAMFICAVTHLSRWRLATVANRNTLTIATVAVTTVTSQGKFSNDL